MVSWDQGEAQQVYVKTSKKRVYGAKEDEKGNAGEFLKQATAPEVEVRVPTARRVTLPFYSEGV